MVPWRGRCGMVRVSSDPRGMAFERMNALDRDALMRLSGGGIGFVEEQRQAGDELLP